MDLNTIEQRMWHLLGRSLAPTTQLAYSRCFNKYMEFCNQFNIVSLPASEYTLMLFTTQVSITSSYNNIKLHLAAVRHVQMLHGYTFDAPRPRLYLLIRGIKREKGNVHKKALRKPITPVLLLQFHRYLSQSCLVVPDRAMLWEAATTAFFGFLRSSEFVSYDKKF